MSGVPYVFGNATTSIPLSQLDVNFATNATIGTTSVGLGNTTTTLVGLTNVSTTVVNTSNVSANTSLLLQTNGTTTAVTIDTNQNVGIGVTPSAWGANYKGIQTSSGAFVSYSNTSQDIYYGAYDSSAGTWKYTVTGYGVNRLALTNGTFQFYVAPSGTAGNAITFTQAMTLDNSGNLLVGTTTSAGRLTVKGTTTDNSTTGITVQDSSAATLFYVRNDGLVNTGVSTNSPYNATTVAAANLLVTSSGTLSRAISSLKYKREVQDAIHGLKELLSLRSVTYKGKNPQDGEKIVGGLIAEEVHEAGLTEFVMYAEDGSPDSLFYGNMVSLCVKAIQELSAQVTTLQTQVTALQAKVGV